MQLVAAAFGNLEKVMTEELQRAEEASSGGMQVTVEALKARLRAIIMEVFGSQRLANAWRSKLYPAPPKVSLGAAGTVFTNAPHIIDAFSAATTIRSKSGFFLAIPSPEALTMRGSRNERPTPDSIERRLGQKLQFVYRPGSASLLVADLRRRTGKRGGYAAPTEKTRKTESVVLFFLVPFAQLRKVIDLDGAYEQALDDLASNILREWNRGDA